MEKSRRRVDAFVKDGAPKKLRIYDNGGKTADRYTVVFTGRYLKMTMGEIWVLGMGVHPFHPQGIGTHLTYREPPDVPSYKHLGKKIQFADLPEDCRKCVLQDYRYLWDLPINALGRFEEHIAKDVHANGGRLPLAHLRNHMSLTGPATSLTKSCKACRGEGVFFFTEAAIVDPDGGEHIGSTIERCEFCKRFASDKEASLHVQAVFRRPT